MSAFIVSDNHLNYLMNFANTTRNLDTIYTRNGETRTEYRTNSVDDLETMGNILVSANYASVNARYNETEGPHVFEFTPRTRLMTFDPVQVIKACDCFDYQASEVDSYDKTVAAQIIEQIRKHAIRTLPGYENAKWDIA